VGVGRIERPNDLVVVAARLAVAQELHALDLDLLRVGLRLKQRDDLGHELVERHRELAVLVAGQQRSADGRRLELWERHEVAKRFEDHKTLIHPELGPIELDCQVLFTEDQTQALLVLTAPPRSDGYDKLHLLAVLGQEHFAEAERR
jgi:MmyB-like transcription regulator ligand binding domain